MMIDGCEEVADVRQRQNVHRTVSELNSPPLTEDDRRRGGSQDQHAAGRPRESKHIEDSVFAVSRHERYVDDITGQPLEPELCRRARAEELAFFHSKDVWDLRQVQEAWNKTGRPPISVRWGEVNKDDDQNPKV